MFHEGLALLWMFVSVIGVRGWNSEPCTYKCKNCMHELPNATKIVFLNFLEVHLFTTNCILWLIVYKHQVYLYF